MFEEIRAFYGRRIGELWLAGWGVLGAVCVGVVIWWWG